MSDLTIYKINHSYIKIECSLDVALALSDAFKFEVPGYKFMPSYRLGQFDGFIRLFNMGSRTIASGLYSKVIDFAEKHDYTCEIVDDSSDTGYSPPGYQTQGVTREVIEDYMLGLNLHARGEPLLTRDYQVDGVTIAIRDRQAIIVAVTGAGKSNIIYCIFRYVTEELGLRCLLIVPTVGLTTQIKSDFKDYSSHNEYAVDANVHLISAGVDKNTRKPIVISTFQSLKDVSPEWINSFGLIMVDEGHKIVAKSFQDIFSKATEVPFRLACTGTIHDMKCNVLTMQGMTGPIHEVAIAKTLIRDKQLVPLKIKAISIKYPVDVCKSFKGIEYDDEIKWITSNPKRNNFIRKLAINCKGTTLVFFRFIEHGQVLFDLIKESVGNTREVFLMDGSVEKDEREIIRKAANSSDAIIIASYGTMSTGVNIPTVESMIVAHPVRSKLTYLQSLGRGLRLAEGKTHCNLYDIGDQLTYKSKVNTTYLHFGERLQMLTREGYDFDLVDVQF